MIVDSNPTCTGEGSGHYECIRSGCTATKPADPIPPTGHHIIEKEKIYTQDPVTFEDHWMIHYICDQCSDVDYWQ